MKVFSLRKDALRDLLLCESKPKRFDMTTTSRRRLPIALILCAATIGFIRADPQSTEAQFEMLRQHFEDEKAKYLAEYQKAKTEEERERITLPYPAHSMVDDFLKLEEANRSTRAGISALHQLVSQAFSVGDADSSPAKGRQAALKILGDHYADHPDLDAMFFWLSGGALGPEDKPFLRRAAQSSQRHVRGTALLALANYLAVEAQLIPAWKARLALVETEPESFADDIKLCQQVLTRWQTIDPDASRREALELLKMVAAEYGDVLEAPRTGYGPTLLKIERTANDPLTNRKRRELADLGETMQFELTHLSVGQPAPEITGPDERGKELKLSEQRGKATVIMFSFKGCGPCEAMYPANRKLVQTYRGRPFAFLGVMGDELGTVRELVAEKTITWPCWWEGKGNKLGSIAARWNVSSWPTIYVLDHRGMIRYCNLQGDLLAKAVSQLVAEAEQNR
jgi:peroxiredoxin